MNFIKKALHIPNFLRDGEETKPWESEPDPYRRDLIRLTDYCVTSDQDNISMKLQALAEIGDISYIGGSDSIKGIQNPLLSYLLDLIKDPSDPGPLRTQALRTISMVSHRNRIVQDYVTKDASALACIVDIIADVTRVLDSRWGCYALLMLVNDNAGGMRKVKDMEQAEDILSRAADLPMPWLSWDKNYADVLLKQLGFRDYKASNEEASRTTINTRRNVLAQT